MRCQGLADFGIIITQRRTKCQNLIETPAETLAGQEKCIKLPALNARRNVKFLSSQQKASQFFAEIALIKERSSKSFNL